VSKAHHDASRPRDRARRGIGAAAQCGTFLLEALVGALIFAVAALAIAGFQARAVRHLNDAQFRSEARQVALATLAQMQAADAASLYAEFDMRAAGNGYRALVAAAKRLPGADDARLPPELLITPGPSAGSRNAAIAVRWQVPGDNAIHRYAAAAVVGGR